MTEALIKFVVISTFINGITAGVVIEKILKKNKGAN